MSTLSWFTDTMNRVPLRWTRSLVMRPLLWGAERPHFSFWRFGAGHVAGIIRVTTKETSWAITLWGREGTSPWAGTLRWRRVELRAVVRRAESALLNVAVVREFQWGLRLDFVRVRTWKGVMCCGVLWSGKAMAVMVLSYKTVGGVKEVSPLGCDMGYSSIVFKNFVTLIIVCHGVSYQRTP